MIFTILLGDYQDRDVPVVWDDKFYFPLFDGDHDIYCSY